MLSGHAFRAYFCCGQGGARELHAHPAPLHPRTPAPCPGPANIVNTWSAFLIGVTGGMVYYGASKLVLYVFKIDDPLDAIGERTWVTFLVSGGKGGGRSRGLAAHIPQAS